MQASEWSELTKSQFQVCQRFGTSAAPISADDIVGVSAGLREGDLPANGLRHPPKPGESGWYLWGGEKLSTAPDFFVPLHAGHLAAERPEIIPYLALPPGWRFLIAPGHEDVWNDPTLLDV